VATGTRRKRRGTVADGASEATTRENILTTALTILGREGFQALTTRAIAEEGGVNQALINYHFGTKQNLLLEMAKSLEPNKYSRQWQMYAEPDLPLSAKWRAAVHFYRDDLADGWIRITQELYALAHTDPEIAETLRAIQRRWVALLSEVAGDALPRLGIEVPPALVVNALVSFWDGTSARILIGETEENGRFFATLDAIGDWLEERERLVAAGEATAGGASG
jgi:AcrR family transcriptional regulator